MENSIMVFSCPQFGQIRTAGTSDNPLFCLADVCKALDLGNPSQVKTRLNSKGVQLIDTQALINNEGVIINKLQNQANFITEANLYKCIFQSRKPEAELFQDWVTSEVLPSIRRTGGYMVANTNETPEEIMARALQVANDTLKRREERLQLLQQQNSLQEQVIKQQAPKVDYHDRVLTSTSTYTVTQIAKEFGFGAETLNRKLHERGVQYKQSGQWLLYAKYQDKGYTKTITRQYTGATGQTHTSQHTVWTETGRKFIHQLLSDQTR